MIAPLQFSPDVLLARMLLTTVTVAPPLLLKMAPPRLALLPEKVLFVTARVPALKMAPPRPGKKLSPVEKPLARLPEKVLLVTVAVPLSLLMAPPRLMRNLLVLLPEKALLVTVRVPALWIAPLFAEKVLLVMIVVPPLLMAPPMVGGVGQVVENI